MLVWFIYDISDDKVRKKIIRIAQQSGLYRVQKSVFLGNIDNNTMDEAVLRSEEVLNEDTDSLYVFPMCKQDFKSVILKGKAFDKSMVTDEVKALFL
ncbi:MAG: CRISPR-associated endonuclease Cas2 [Spirochaetales bacterium]|nr:CRISPR-associated endonuclease Cas2 [Spirochaetales bacterium]